MKQWKYGDRWALVTGASAGIGEAFARALAARGMSLVLVARRKDRLRALADRLAREHGTQTAVVPGDLGAPGAARSIWERAADGRPIHLLVNNAGFGLQGRFDQLSLERQSEMVRLNCTAVLELAHLALPPMRSRGEGGIINVASLAAFQPVPRMAAYAASKAFVLSLSLALRDENRDAGVRVVALCPGTVPTEFQEVAGFRRALSAPGVKTPDEVVRASLRALERERGWTIPGATNRLGGTLGRLLPLSLVTRVAGAAIRRMG